MKHGPAHPWRHAAAALVLVLAGSAQAQLRLPQVAPPSLGLPLPNVQQALPPLPQVLPVPPGALRDLARRHPQQVELDPSGEAIRRGELLWLSPDASALERARAEGFTVLREDELQEIGVRQFVLRAPAGLATPRAAARLRELDAQAVVDFNHLYAGSGEAAPGVAARTSGAAAAVRIGLVDGGVDRAHPALRQQAVAAWGCDGREVPAEHGTAIASLLVGRDGDFQGLLPQASLLAADVYCGDVAGGAAASVARALDWLVRERVPVINVSLVGPPNRVLERATQSVIRRGHIVVAAVGNDGPAAAPLYPASYPGVVGVTAVNARRRPLPEAARGPQVMFAASGADVGVARPGGGYASARGTSFAAPVVAASLALMLPQPDPAGAAAAIERLARSALDLGEPGRDPIFGFGLVSRDVAP